MAKKQVKKPVIKAVNQPASHAMPAKGKSMVSVKMRFCILLGAISIIVYANTLTNGYALDDYPIVKDNTLVRQGLSAIPEILLTPYRHGLAPISNDLYRPLSLVVFAINAQFFGVMPMPLHLTNILLFAGCVILLFLFLDAFFEQKKTSVAFIAALLFALHPIHTEVVANIKSLDELLCFFFAFLCLNVYNKYMQTGKISQLLLGAFCFLLSFLAKETVISFLFIIPLIFFFYRIEDKRRGIYITCSAITAAIICLGIRYQVLSYYHANNLSDIAFIDNALAKKDLSFESRIATAIFILGYYLKLIFIPHPLICDYSYNAIPFVHFGNPMVLLSLAAYIFLAVFSIKRFLKNHKDAYAFGILFFLATIAMFSNIVFLIGTTMGERLLFFPSVGFCLIIALLIEKFAVKTENTGSAALNRKKALAIVIPISLVYSFIAINRNSEWQSNYTLYSADIEKAPGSGKLNDWLGCEMLNTTLNEEKDPENQKRLRAEAVVYLNKAIAIYPEFGDGQADLANVYFYDSKYDLAIIHAQAALKIAPTNSMALIVLGQVYIATNKYSQAIDSLRVVIANNPSNENAQMLTAVAFYDNAQYDSSSVHCLETLRLNPQNAYVVNTLGGDYLSQKKYQQAIDMYRKAIALNPDMGSACANIGVAYLQWQKYDSAIYYARKAISIESACNTSYQILASVYSTTGKSDSAKKYEAIMQKK